MEKIIGLFERLVVSLEAMAANQGTLITLYKNADVEAAPAATTEKKGRSKAKKEEVAAPPVEIPVTVEIAGPPFEEDDLGGAPEAAAPTATRDEALNALRDLSMRKGRPASLELMMRLSGCGKTGEIEAKPNAAEIFGAIVAAAKSA